MVRIVDREPLATRNVNASPANGLSFRSFPIRPAIGSWVVPSVELVRDGSAAAGRDRPLRVVDVDPLRYAGGDHVNAKTPDLAVSDDNRFFARLSLNETPEMRSIRLVARIGFEPMGASRPNANGESQQSSLVCSIGVRGSAPSSVDSYSFGFDANDVRKFRSISSRIADADVWQVPG